MRSMKTFEMNFFLGQRLFYLDFYKVFNFGWKNNHCCIISIKQWAIQKCEMGTWGCRKVKRGVPLITKGVHMVPPWPPVCIYEVLPCVFEVHSWSGWTRPLRTWSEILLRERGFRKPSEWRRPVFRHLRPGSVQLKFPENNLYLS